MEHNIKGLIYKVESKDFYVLNDDDTEVRCSLRGRLKKEHSLKKRKLKTLDIVVVGDIVEYSLNDDGTGVIEGVVDRENYISRKAPKLKGAGNRGERLEQIIAANIDNLFIVTSIHQPEFNNRVLDRIIVTGESEHLNVYIIINKSDLDEFELIPEWKEFYEEIGYTVFAVDAHSGDGIEELKDTMAGTKSLFWGQSGVGKSTILNKIAPELNFKTGEVSQWSSKGKHTTVTAIIKKIDNDTYIIDTPGIKEIEPFGIQEENLGFYFIEFTDYLEHCRFNTCTHNHEPGCAVREAVENGDITVERYESYLNMLDSIEDDMIF